jgi:hypothetical protein
MNGTDPKSLLPRFSSAMRGTGFARFLSILFVLSVPEFAARAAGAQSERAALIPAAQATESRLAGFVKEGFTAVALMLTEPNATREARAARAVIEAKLPLDYWIEVARNPAMAEAHPEWMASVQTHEEWRRFFPEFPKPGSKDMVKVYPWVPARIGKHLTRISSAWPLRVSWWPAPKLSKAGDRIYLNGGRTRDANPRGEHAAGKHRAWTGRNLGRIMFCNALDDRSDPYPDLGIRHVLDF